MHIQSRRHWKTLFLSNVRQAAYAWLGLTVIGLGLAGWFALRASSAFPVERVNVHAAFSHVSRGTLRRIIRLYLHKNFFALDVRALQKTLQSRPWIASVDIRRQWPGRLTVQIKEKKAVARWGEKGLVDSQGRVFYPIEVSQIEGDSALKALPRFIGPKGLSGLMWKSYQHMSAPLQPLGLQIKTLILTDRHAWKAILTRGVEVNVGREQLWERWMRLIKIARHVLFNEARPVHSIDLRYPSGVAVG